ncbi:hypothetical protein CRUP_025928 [Coryphaenoides rupestris]|nr:hypothetical protein CRUP_025928 [Coryphaenoides rupestris]
MHSFDMRMDNGWMGRYRRALTHLVLHLSHQWAPLAQAQQQIEALDSDNQWDADTAASIGQLEVELLGERLQELLGDTESQNAECLQRLRGFLQANTDLAKRFSAELRAIDPLEAAVPR